MAKKGVKAASGANRRLSGDKNAGRLSEMKMHGALQGGPHNLPSVQKNYGGSKSAGYMSKVPMGSRKGLMKMAKAARAGRSGGAGRKNGPRSSARDSAPSMSSSKAPKARDNRAAGLKAAQTRRTRAGQ